MVSRPLLSSGPGLVAIYTKKKNPRAKGVVLMAIKTDFFPLKKERKKKFHSFIHFFWGKEVKRSIKKGINFEPMQKGASACYCNDTRRTHLLLLLLLSHLSLRGYFLLLLLLLLLLLFFNSLKRVVCVSEMECSLRRWFESTFLLMGKEYGGGVPPEFLSRPFLCGR